jgi:hypothetical protein
MQVGQVFVAMPVWQSAADLHFSCDAIVLSGLQTINIPCASQTAFPLLPWHSSNVAAHAAFPAISVTHA